jgi:hypothetical protein
LLASRKLRLRCNFDDDDDDDDDDDYSNNNLSTLLPRRRFTDALFLISGFKYKFSGSFIFDAVSLDVVNKLMRDF